MNTERQIVIADTAPFRSEEMNGLAQLLIPKHRLAIHTFECWSEPHRDLVAVQVAVKVNNLLDTHSDIILVTNCALGVKHNLISTIQKIEQAANRSIRKVLLTCRKGHEVRSGFQERGLSLDGVEHVVWNSLHLSLHQDRMRSIFQGDPPEENPL